MTGDSIPLDPHAHCEAIVGTLVYCERAVEPPPRRRWPSPKLSATSGGFTAMLDVSPRRNDLRLWLVPCDGMSEADASAIARDLARQAIQGGALCVRFSVETMTDLPIGP